MKKSIILSIVVALMAIYGVMVVKSEMAVCAYQRATIAYVQGAERNGAISASESRYMQHLADASLWVHAATRKGWCVTIREAVDRAYAQQRAFESDGSYQALSK